MPWILPTQDALGVGAAVGEPDGSGRKPEANGLGVPVPWLGVGDGVAGPLATSTHGEPLGSGTAVAAVLSEPQPLSSSSASTSVPSQRRRTHGLLAIGTVPYSGSDRRGGGFALRVPGKGGGRGGGVFVGGGVVPVRGYRARLRAARSLVAAELIQVPSTIAAPGMSLANMRFATRMPAICASRMPRRITWPDSGPEPGCSNRRLARSRPAATPRAVRAA